MVHVTLVKPSVMQNLYGLNKIINLKVQNHQNSFKPTPTYCLTGTVISNVLKNVKTRKNLETYAALWKPDLIQQKGFERLVYLEIVSHRAIDDIIETPQKEVHFFFFKVYCIVTNFYRSLMLDEKQKSCLKHSLVTHAWLFD